MRLAIPYTAHSLTLEFLGAVLVQLWAVGAEDHPEQRR